MRILWVSIAAGSDLSPILLSPPGGYEYLAKVMDQYHRAFYVYDDFCSAGNHFPERGLMCNAGDEASAPPMDEACTERPWSGLNCIKCRFNSNGPNWGGWLFVNSVVPVEHKDPQPNWGDFPGGGHNLTGATRLTFRARGKEGGERVRFFCLGMGRRASTGCASAPHPGSSRKVSSSYVTLTREWCEYAIPLTGKNMTNVLLGFGWQTKSALNDFDDITFYLDEISYDLPRPDAPRFLVSYQTLDSGEDFDLVMRNCAFTYDNALALMAFMEAGDRPRAKLIADALVYAQEHDRYYTDGRLRNAYQGGDLAPPPGWAQGSEKCPARLPGWWDKAQGRWLEDSMAAGTYAGNMAWAMLALLAYYEQVGGKEYLEAVEKMGAWIEQHCRDERGAGGYTAGYEGWEPEPHKLEYKSTEHNLDLCAVFQRLYLITGEHKWRRRAAYAKCFVRAMWDNQEQKFWTGTTADGATIFRDVVPIDIQIWALLALKDEYHVYEGCLDFAESGFSVCRGCDYNQDADGIWYEGTAHLAAGFSFTGQRKKWEHTLAFLHEAQDSTGGLHAADRDETSTGFHLNIGGPWVYYQRLHVGATAWLVLAEHSANPFWMGRESLGLWASAGKRNAG